MQSSSGISAPPLNVTCVEKWSLSMELRFLRDTDKREVDFVVLRDGRPEFAVECKTGERAVSPAAIYFKGRTPIPAFFQVHLGQKQFLHAGTGVHVLPFTRFCLEKSLP
jgi:uncharacterized protein